MAGHPGPDPEGQPDRSTPAELDAALTRFGVAGETLRADPVERLVLTEAPAPAAATPAPARLLLGRELGRGGMGLVHLAEQTSLGREVAVKRLRPEVRGEAARAALLQEAWITGALEHPSIVPVYHLEYDEAGDPLIVMKRIEGVLWADCLRDPSLLPGRDEGDDPLGHHLQVFMQVCNAVHFAHARRIVHRDLKPQNVMIGGFGEVYVLDWGLAAALEQRDGRPLPLASDERGIAGTPAYMAPEMALGDGAAIDERTDVYLLGAVLHEVLTGSPLHTGADLREVLRSAYLSEPHPHGPEVPAELAAICNRATEAERDRRFPSADALRVAVRDYLAHRSSIQLASEARARLDALQPPAERAAGAGAGAGAGDPQAHERLAECRFGFQQALRAWPDNGPARQGLHETLLAMIEVELARENVAAAAALLSELPAEVAGALGDRVDQLRRTLRRKQREIAALRVLERERDLTRGSRARSYAALCIALATFLNLGLYLLARAGDLAWKPAFFIAYGAGTLAVISFTFLIFWRSLMQNQANREIAYTLAVAGGGTFLLRVLVVLGDLPFDAGHALEYLVWGCGFAVVAVMQELRLVVAALLMFAGAVAGVIWPPHSLLVGWMAGLTAMVWTAWVWWPRRGAAGSGGADASGASRSWSAR